MSMRAVVEPNNVATFPGFPVEFSVTVTNALHLVDAFSVRVLGVDPAWVVVDQERLQLFPGTVGVFQVRVNLPEDFPSGRRTLTVQVLSDLAPTKPTLLTITLDIDARPRVTMVADPVLFVAGSKAQFALTVTNEGNSPTRVEFACEDPESTSTSTFDRPVLELGPGEQRSTTMRVKGKRPWFGQPTQRILNLSLIGGSPGSERSVTIAHRPRVSRLMVSFIGLLVAASIFGIVFSRNLTSVVESTAIDPALLEQAFGSASPGAGVAPGAITGTVTARSSGDGIPGATVEVFLADEPSLPVRSVATDEEGAFTVDNMGTGPFRLRAVAGGFDSRWLGDVAEFVNALPVKVEPGGTVGGFEIVLGGQPATLRGGVVGGTVVGARVEVIAPAAATGGVEDATLAAIEVDDTGVFEFTDIPAPGEYKLRVRRIGSITTVLTLQLGAGETREGVTVQLRTGDGLIGGTVFGTDGPLGGASVVIVSPDTEAGTLTLTSGAVGSFTVPGLLTPNSYSVNVTADGYAPQSLTVSLTSGQQLADLNVTLEPSTGSVTGRLRSALGGNLGGAPVTLTNGQTTWSTTSLTVDDPRTPDLDERGTYSLSNIPIPGVYTLTLGGGDTVPVIRNVVLIPLERNQVVDADLVGSVAVVRGTVRDQEGPAGGVTIIVSDGVNTRQVLTATSCVDGTTDCVGTYRVESLAPGTYTITYRRVGSAPVSRQAVLSGGDQLVSDVTLAPRASITVRLCSSGTVSNGVTTCSSSALLVGYQTRLWLESAFPGGEPLGSLLTGSTGSVQFNDLDAPLRYVVDIAQAAGEAPVSSSVISLGASQALAVDIIVPLGEDS